MKNVVSRGGNGKSAGRKFRNSFSNNIIFRRKIRFGYRFLQWKSPVSRGKIDQYSYIEIVNSLGKTMVFRGKILSGDTKTYIFALDRVKPI